MTVPVLIKQQEDSNEQITDWCVVAAATLAVAAAGLAQAAEPLQPYPVKGQVIQRLKAFDNPEGSIFSAEAGSCLSPTPLSWACPIRDST